MKMTLVGAILGGNISTFRKGWRRREKFKKKWRRAGKETKKMRERERIGDDRGDVCSGSETQGRQQ